MKAKIRNIKIEERWINRKLGKFDETLLSEIWDEYEDYEIVNIHIGDKIEENFQNVYVKFRKI